MFEVFRAIAAGAGLLLLVTATGAVDASVEIEHWRTSNGARAYFVAVPEIPMVDTRIVFDAGSARDADKTGLAALTNGLLASGGGDLTADAFAAILDGVGAQFSAGAQRDLAWLQLRSLSDPEYLTPAVDVVALSLREPAFRSGALTRERNRMLTRLRSDAQSPAAVARKTFFRALYGNHPYAAPPEGLEATLNVIQPDDVRLFHRRYYVGANAVVAIVGALDIAGAQALAEDLVGGLPAGESAPALPEAEPLAAARVVRVSHPSTQSHVLIGQIGIRRDDSQYFGLLLANRILGGDGLISDLAQEIRQKRGLSYSVGSRIEPLRGRGPFWVRLQTRNDQVDEAVEIARSTLRRFVREGPVVERIDAAKQNLVSGFPLQIDSNREIVRYLAMIGFHRLPLDYLQTFPRRIEDLSPQQVRDAVRRRIQPDRLLTVIVGG